MNKVKRIAECIGGVATLLSSIVWMSCCIVGMTVIKLNDIAGKMLTAYAEYRCIWITMAICAVVAFTSGSVQLYPPYIKSKRRYNDKKIYNALSILSQLVVGIVCITQSVEIAHIDADYDHTYTVIGAIAFVCVVPSVIGLFTKHTQPEYSDDI